MKLKFPFFLIFIIISMGLQAQNSSGSKVRHFHDSIGFAKHSWQMDSIISRIGDSDKIQNQEVYKAVINPHDDYKYAAGLYAKTLSGIKANTVILVGVAHRARNFDLQDKIIFGSFNSWEAPYGNVKVSAIRNEILKNLHADTYIVHDSMIQLEHSLEAIVPFLKHQNKAVEIIPLLVPYMKFEDMQRFSKELSQTLSEIMEKRQMEYGEDLAIIISNDAIHYGSEDWGGSDLAPFGTDKAGNEKAHQKDLRIIEETLQGKLEEEKIKTFNNYTVKPENYKEYNWTWCGRYSVPFGLLFANELNKSTANKSLHGKMLDYRSSLKNEHLQVEDLGMGTTAPSKPTHWVAYLGMAHQ